MSPVTSGFVDNAETCAEAEASLHYIMSAHQNLNWLQVPSSLCDRLIRQTGTIFAVCDAGGSTVDTAVYRCGSTSPLRLVEHCAPGCAFPR